MENNLLSQKEYQKRYRAAGVVLFAMSILVLLVRISTYFIGDAFNALPEYAADFAMDLIFTLLVQVVILFVMPLLVYKYMLKMRLKDVFSFSNFRKTEPVNLLLAVIIGMLGIVVTIGISFLSVVFLSILGYAPSNSSTSLPTNFNLFLFIGSLILTAVLPGFCEEFTMRGGFLNALRSALPLTTVILVSAFAFGLFHQYIMQTFYTACFGALMAFVTIRTKSIFPAMIIHFVNNGLSVYLSHAEAYGWLGGNFFNNISEMLINGQAGLLILAYLCITAIFILFLVLLAKINPKETVMPVMLDGSTMSRDNTVRAITTLDSITVKKAPPLEINPKASTAKLVLSGMVHPNLILQTVNDERIVFINNNYYLFKNGYAHKLRPKPPFKPRFADNIFFIAALITTCLSSLFTFIWGLIL